MVSRALVIDLFRHMEWADARVWSVVRHISPADARLHALLIHTHVVQHAFLTAWQGGDLEAASRGPDPVSSLDEVSHWGRPLYARAREVIAQAAEARFEQPMTLPWADLVAASFGRRAGPTTFGETCLQVASHTTYHRGQINARIRELGVAPPPVDYIAWLWLDRPAADWAS